MSQYVDIEFECLPLRSVGRLDIPIDASPAYQARCERIKKALEAHGSLNSYFLYNARCTFHLTNQPDFGMLEYRFEGTLLTDPTDQHAVHADLHVELVRETVDWLTEPASAWLAETVGACGPRRVRPLYSRRRLGPDHRANRSTPGAERR